MCLDSRGDVYCLILSNLPGMIFQMALIKEN